MLPVVRNEKLLIQLVGNMAISIQCPRGQECIRTPNRDVLCTPICPNNSRRCYTNAGSFPVCCNIEPIWDLFKKLQVQYQSGFYDSGSHFS